MTEDQTLTLEDGRTLGFAEYGDPTGTPIFLFHGFPGTRHVGKVGHDDAERLGVRVICPERPGFGLSDLQADRRISDWPADVVALADSMGIERFGVVGISGGGPYAAACARFLSERLSRTAIVCGVGPFDAPGATFGMSRQNRIIFGLSRRIPGVVGKLMASTMNRARRDPDKMIARMKRSLPEVDQVVLDRPDAIAMIMGGNEPWSAEAIGLESSLFARPWGFELSDIRSEVHLFQGDLDKNVPPTMGRYQVAQIPDCVAHFYPDEGHLSLVVNRGEEILSLFV